MTLVVGSLPGLVMPTVIGGRGTMVTGLKTSPAVWSDPTVTGLCDTRSVMTVRVVVIVVSDVDEGAMYTSAVMAVVTVIVVVRQQDCTQAG